MNAATSAYGLVEGEVLAEVWNIIVSTRAELLMFAIAMVGYSVLFMQRTTRNPKLQTNKMKTFDQEDAPKSKSPRSSGRGSSNSTNSPSTDIAKQINMIR